MGSRGDRKAWAVDEGRTTSLSGGPPAVDYVHQQRIVRRFLQDLRVETDPALILPLLDQFRPLLARHFEEEERPGGMLERIRAGGAEGRRAARRLAAQHRQLLGELDELYEEPRWDAVWLRRLWAFTDRLAAHEAHESGFIGRPGGLRSAD